MIKVHRCDYIQHPVLYRDEVFTLYVEELQDFVLIHCDVHQWGKEQALHINDTACFVLCSIPKEVLCLARSRKVRRFAEMMGFEYIKELYGEGKVGDLLRYNKEIQ